MTGAVKKPGRVSADFTSTARDTAQIYVPVVKIMDHTNHYFHRNVREKILYSASVKIRTLDVH